MPGKRRLRRGIYLLPTLFTTGNLFCGFFSLVAAAKGSFELAGALVILAAVLDGLDGRIARMTRTTSDFGLQFDSLADIVSFGIAPGFLLYQWALLPLRQSGWLIAFLFVVCAAMRLARFNIRRAKTDTRYFAGLPTPPAAALLACIVLVVGEPPDRRWVSTLLGVLVVTVAMLMISRIRYRSFKDLDLRNRRSYLWVFPIAASLVLIVAHPKESLTALFALYVLSGPAGYVFTALARDRRAGELNDEPAVR